MAGSLTYGDISEKTALYSAYKLTGRLPLMPQVINAGVHYQYVKPIDIECRYCHAPAGQNCTRWRKRNRRRGKYKAPRTPHPDRAYDAHCASEAARAMLENI